MNKKENVIIVTIGFMYNKNPKMENSVKMCAISMVQGKKTEAIAWSISDKIVLDMSLELRYKK